VLVGVGLTLTGTSIALILAPPSFGWLVDHLGWANAGYAFAPIPLIAMVCMIMYREKKSVPALALDEKPLARHG
jgi:predicted MFS family arabinose efflux permease